tara:strand:+ start:2894 stop:3853 length:960 start_codon:yes stop_codon:yes gene_type:complete
MVERKRKRKRKIKKSIKKNDKIYTFKCNRSDIIKEILTNLGFNEESGDKRVDFSFWDTYYTKDIESKIKTIDKKYINVIDNKRDFYNMIKKYNLEKYIPKTYSNLSELTSDMLDKDKIYFFKYIYGSGGKDVYPVKTMDDIHKIVKYDIKDCILQEEVPNMYLHEDNYKTTMRNYVLVCDRGIYFYNEGYIYIYKTKYDKDDLDNNIHNNIFTHCDYEKLSKQYYYQKILPKLCKISSEILNNYFKGIHLKNRYIILGVDFILDKNYNPFIIEINGMPHLYSSCGEGSVKRQMINDFINLYVLPKVKNKRVRKGGWIKI